ncbi:MULTISPECIES: hypothetical protein [unclassified Haladaptatus]|uniref:DUF7511 domain-containing protein n=1 Tax=unclassified Haladaptatus TaxID=2622732 RepID=UPI00209C3A2C|nr:MULTISPECIES: hypothetical protein [unclassified Haladaptatus]MCO8242689.1 hypothetical protein [Haladaptatus sp. AB643]MCO8252448.1 hypothetical protein [Haladaptatus sp. AB618]
MTGHFHTVDTRSESKRNAVDERSFELASVVVEYDGQPDRCTIYPEEATRFERMASWITADADVFVSLDDMD